MTVAGSAIIAVMVVMVMMMAVAPLDHHRSYAHAAVTVMMMVVMDDDDLGELDVAGRWRFGPPRVIRLQQRQCVGNGLEQVAVATGGERLVRLRLRRIRGIQGR